MNNKIDYIFKDNKYVLTIETGGHWSWLSKAQNTFSFIYFVQHSKIDP